MLWHCWLGDRKGIKPVKSWVLGLLVVTVWSFVHLPVAVVITTSHHPYCKKIQNGGILVPTYLGVLALATCNNNSSNLWEWKWRPTSLLLVGQRDRRERLCNFPITPLFSYQLAIRNWKFSCWLHHLETNDWSLVNQWLSHNLSVLQVSFERVFHYRIHIGAAVIAFIIFGFCVFCFLVVLVQLSVVAKWLARKTPLMKLWWNSSMSRSRGGYLQRPGWRVRVYLYVIVLPACLFSLMTYLHTWAYLCWKCLEHQPTNQLTHLLLVCVYMHVWIRNSKCWG